MDFLMLPGFVTTGVRLLPDRVSVEARVTAEPDDCPHCRTSLWPLRPHGTKRQTIADAPVRGKAAEIELARRRYRCMGCGRTSLQPLPGVDERRGMTQRLADLVAAEALSKPFNLVELETGVAASTVRSIFLAHVEALEGARVIETPRVLGIDGKYIQRRERLVLTDIERRRVVEISASIRERSVAQTLFRLPGRWRVEVVTMDMSAPLRRAVRHALPQAVIVVDRFHVQRMANQAIDRVRRRIHMGMTPYDRRLVMRDPRLLRKRRGQLLEPVRDSNGAVVKGADGTPIMQPNADGRVVEKWFRDVPELGVVYNLKEDFFEVWGSSCSASARVRYEAWERSVPEELRGGEGFGPLLTAMKNWGEEVLNFFDHRFTNAFTESANNVIKSVQRRARRADYATIRARVLYGPALRGVDAPEGDSDGDASTRAA